MDNSKKDDNTDEVGNKKYDLGPIVIYQRLAIKVRNGKLSLIEAAVLSSILYLEKSKKKEGCFVSNEYLAKYYGVGVRRIKQIISTLIEKKLISKEKGTVMRKMKKGDECPEIEEDNTIDLEE